MRGTATTALQGSKSRTSAKIRGTCLAHYSGNTCGDGSCRREELAQAAACEGPDATCRLLRKNRILQWRDELTHFAWIHSTYTKRAHTRVHRRNKLVRPSRFHPGQECRGRGNFVPQLQFELSVRPRGATVSRVFAADRTSARKDVLGDRSSESSVKLKDQMCIELSTEWSPSRGRPNSQEISSGWARSVYNEAANFGEYHPD